MASMIRCSGLCPKTGTCVVTARCREGGFWPPPTRPEASGAERCAEALRMDRGEKINAPACRWPATRIPVRWICWRHCVSLSATCLANQLDVRLRLALVGDQRDEILPLGIGRAEDVAGLDRKRTRMNSSHVKNSYADFC